MGSAGSGNFGHSGRPGERGGSAAGSGPVKVRMGISTHPPKLADVNKTAAHFEVQSEQKPNRKIGGSSMGVKKLAEHTEFSNPVKVVVSGQGGYRTRTAEDVVAIDLPKEPGGDIIFHRRYPGGRVIKSPYRSANVTRIKIRSSHQNPERNYHL